MFAVGAAGAGAGAGAGGGVGAVGDERSLAQLAPRSVAVQAKRTGHNDADLVNLIDMEFPCLNCDRWTIGCRRAISRAGAILPGASTNQRRWLGSDNKRPPLRYAARWGTRSSRCARRSDR